MQNKQTNAIVNGVRQQLCQVYEAEQALCRGTLFPELDKPLHGLRCDCSPCATQEQQQDFAAWELRLYLNTNPHDQQALKLYRQCCARMNGRGYASVDMPAPKPAKPGCCAPQREVAPRTLRAMACENDISFTRPHAREDAFIRVEDACAVEEACTSAPVDCWTWNDAPWPWEKCACRKEG